MTERKGILAQALRHQTPPDDLVDLPGAVPRPPPRLPPLPSHGTDPSTSRASHYSPEELEYRSRRGILSLALTQAHSFPPLDPPAFQRQPQKEVKTKPKPPLQRSQQYVVDSSDEESRGGMLGTLLLGRKRARTLSREGEKKKKPLKRRMSQGDISGEDPEFDYGSGILGKALLRFSTRESLAESKPSGSRRPSTIARSPSVSMIHPDLSSVTGDGRRRKSIKK